MLACSDIVSMENPHIVYASDAAGGLEFVLYVDNYLQRPEAGKP